MKISIKKVKSLKPCNDGLVWYEKNGSTDLLKTLLKVDKRYPAWARWLFTRLMTKKENLKIAIFSAEQVLNIFEKKYPNDNRPRNAIEAAKEVLRKNNIENREKARYAADADAADAAANAAYYAADAADAAADAYYAANAAYYAAYYAAYANATDKGKIQRKIIRKAVEILDSRKRSSK